MLVQCRRKFLTVGLVVGTRSPFLHLVFRRALLPQYLRIRPNSSQFFLEALIFVVLVADFTTSPSQVNYDVLAAGIFFTTVTQNVLEIAAVTVAAVITGLHTIVIVIVAATVAVVVAIVAKPISKVSDQRQLW